MEEQQNKHPLIQSVLNYLNMQSTGAFLITGAWGCGKTYFFNNEITEELKSLGITTVKVSLFGVESTDKVLSKIKSELLYLQSQESKNDGKEPLNDKIKRKSIAFFRDHKDKIYGGLSLLTDKDLSLLIDSLIDFHSIDKKKIAICFDDLERAIRSGNPDTLMGMINDLTENQGFKVIVTANEGFMKQTDKQSLQFKEKVVEKSVLYKPDTRKIFVEMAGIYENAAFTSLLSSEEYLHTIDSTSDVYAHSDYLKTSIQNLRTLKFAISHYYRLYNEYMRGKATLNDANKNELYHMWLFLLGVSIEYKNNKLSYEDRRTLDSFQDIASSNFDIDLEENDIEVSNLFTDEKIEPEETKKYTEEENRKYSKWFYQTYIKSYGKKIFFLPTVYDFITSGSALQGGSLVKELAVVNPPTPTTSPQILLMERFMTGVWKFKDAEFPAALNELYNYVKSASFGDYITYLNATFYICAFKQVLSDNEATIKDNIKSAIDFFTEKVELHPLLVSNVQIVGNELSQEVKWLHSYILGKLDEKQNSILQEDSKKFFNEFCDDIVAFSEHFILRPNQTPSYFNTPVLVGFDPKKVEEKMAAMEPNEALSLARMLKDRYISISPLLTALAAEMPFVEAIRNGLTKRNEPKRILSNKLIEQELQPIVEKVLREYGRNVDQPEQILKHDK